MRGSRTLQKIHLLIYTTRRMCGHSTTLRLPQSRVGSTRGSSRAATENRRLPETLGWTRTRLSQRPVTARAGGAVLSFRLKVHDVIWAQLVATIKLRP